MNTKHFTRTFLLASLLGLLSACAFPGNYSTPTPAQELPTIIVLTGQAAMATNLAGTPSATTNPTATITLTPTDTPIPPTSLPTNTFTPTPVAPLAQIQIFSLGPLSKVASPIDLKMHIVVGEPEKIQVDLVGEDGRLLARKIQGVATYPWGAPVSLKLPFEIRAAAEVGRLSISTKDQEGRLQSVASLHLLLLSVGTNEITPAVDLSERAVFYTPPKRKAEVSGGELKVEGRFQPFNLKPVIVELIAPNGTLLGLRVLNFASTESQAFSTTLPYKISEPTKARLVIRQDDDRIEGLFYLYSQEVLLNP